MNGWKNATRALIGEPQFTIMRRFHCTSSWPSLLEHAALEAFMRKISPDDYRCILVRDAINHSRETMAIPPDDEWTDS